MVLRFRKQLFKLDPHCNSTVIVSLSNIGHFSRLVTLATQILCGQPKIAIKEKFTNSG